MLSSIPPVFPILKQPGLIPPTCSGGGTQNSPQLRKISRSWSLANGLRAYRGWANDGNALLIRPLNQPSCVGFRDALSNDGNGADLEEHRGTVELSLTEIPNTLNLCGILCLGERGDVNVPLMGVEQG